MSCSETLRLMGVVLAPIMEIRRQIREPPLSFAVCQGRGQLQSV